MNALDKISKARTELLLDPDKKFIFWASIGFYLKVVKVGDDNPMWCGGPTMATDGKHLFYSESYVDKLSIRKLMGVFAHEAGHIVLKHIFRRQGREPIPWNVACDLVLNPILINAGLELPEGALYDKKFNGAYAEEVYANNPIKKIPVAGFGCGGALDYPDGAGEGEEWKRAEELWDGRIHQAAQQAKGYGTLPGAFEYLLAPEKVKLDLRSMLLHMIATTVEEDYTWAKPNRRHVWRGLYLPSQKTESTGDFMVGIDTSGSVSREEAAKFLGVVNEVLSNIKPRLVYLVQCDAGVSDVQEYQPGSQLPSEVGIKGCGGTDMRPIWEWVQQENKELTGAIICSDFQMPVENFGEKQHFPVLWATCSEGVKAPWGHQAMLEG
jgi:predicted metal-dependent peptidase